MFVDHHMGKKVGAGIRLEEATGCNLYPARGILRTDILGTLIADDVEFRRFDAKTSVILTFICT